MNTDDPKFTAYTLGELEDLTAAERAEIEALIATKPSAAAEAEETRVLASRLRVELPGEAASTLRGEQREAVLAERKVAAFPLEQRAWWRRAWAPRSIAAGLAVGFGVLTFWGAWLYDGYQAVFANSEVDPLILEVSEFEALAFLIGDKITGGTVARDVGLKILDTKSRATAIWSRPGMFGNELLARAEESRTNRPVKLAESASSSASESQSAPTPSLLASAPVAQEQFAQLESSQMAAASPTGTPISRLEKRAGEALIAFSPQTSDSPLRQAPPVTEAALAKGLTPEIAEKIARFTVGWGNGEKPKFGQVAANSDERQLAGINVEQAGSKDISEREQLGLAFQKNLEPANTDAFDAITDNAFLAARENPLSTFSIDVDTASYAVVRRFLNENQRPPKGVVRIEELLNYFTYDYPQPAGDAPFSATMEVATCPWQPEHRLVRIGLKGREIAKDQRPASNLVFLIDVSGSMRPANRLPLVKESLALLVDQLGAEDRVSIAVYAGASGVVLPATNDKAAIRAALGRLESGGSTNGASGIRLAYELAQQAFIKGGANRVILATDGDFNVGTTNHSELVELIEAKAKTGVFLTVLGFGMGNLKDSTLEKLADKGNGNYAYIDTLLEGKKVLVEQMSGTLVTIAKDVKIQVEFNPAQVGAYRLIGYENRLLKKEDFNDETKDAGEIGAGHTVTALYEVVPTGKATPAGVTPVDALKYQPAPPKMLTEKESGDTFVSAYLAFQAGGKLEERSDFAAALTKYEHAAALLESLTSKSPGWQPQLLKFREARTAEAIARVHEKIARSPGSETPAARRLRPPLEKTDPFDVKANSLESKGPAEAIVAAEQLAISSQPSATTRELLTLKLRYKAPDGDTSKLLEFPLTDAGATWEKSSRDFRFAAAVASYGMLLRDSPHKGGATWDSTLELGFEGKGADISDYRAEFLSLVEKAKALGR